MRSWCLGVGSKESRGARWNERPSSCSHVGLSKELEFSSKCSGHQTEGVGERVLRGLKMRQVSCLMEAGSYLDHLSLTPWGSGTTASGL